MTARSFVVKRSPIVMMRNFIVMQVAGYAAFVGVGALADYGAIYSGLSVASFISYQLVYLLFLACAELVLTLLIFFDWFYTHYTVTPHAIVLARGLLLRRKISFALYEIEGVEARYGILGKLFGYGTLTLRVRGGKAVELPFLPLPHKYAKIIMRYCASGERRALVPFVENPEELLLQPEHERLEFKSTLRWDLKMAAVSRAPEKMVLKTIAAFLNSNGGQLVIGVGDGGEIVGLEHDYKSLTRHGRDGFENHFTHIFNSAIGAEFRQFVKLRFKEVQGKEICIVNVEPAPHPVFARLDGSTEEFYVRTGNSTTPLKLSEAASYLDLWRSRLG